MPHINIEIKARSENIDSIRHYLRVQQADFRGKDFQTDTYFQARQGRLKLREGNIEKNLIFYNRENIQGIKQSDFDLYPVEDGAALKLMLTKSMGVKTIVKKKREIYFIRNIKFHLDEVENLGQFVEIEASNIGFDLSIEELREQCTFYMQAFRISKEDLIAESYSDMVLA